MSDERFQSFEEFWPFYVREHSRKSTRVLHWIGTTAAASCLAASAITRRPWLALVAPVAGYGPAWFSHFFIEKNRPATFTYPAWSLLADLIMWRKTLDGTMDTEVEQAFAAKSADGPTTDRPEPVDDEPGGKTPTNGVSGSNGAAHL